jgi:hypothetical protein
MGDHWDASLRNPHIARLVAARPELANRNVARLSVASRDMHAALEQERLNIEKRRWNKAVENRAIEHVVDRRRRKRNGFHIFFAFNTSPYILRVPVTPTEGSRQVRHVGGIIDGTHYHFDWRTVPDTTGDIMRAIRNIQAEFRNRMHLDSVSLAGVQLDNHALRVIDDPDPLLAQNYPPGTILPNRHVTLREVEREKARVERVLQLRPRRPR